MKHLLLIIVLLLATSIGSIKAQVFIENFEGATIDLTSTNSDATSGSTWDINSRISSQGTKSDSCIVTTSDTTWLTTTNSFSTFGEHAVYLEFDHICKIEFMDSAFIEVSNDNGLTWQRLKGNHYLGAAQFGNVGNRFNELSYGSFWVPGTNDKPLNTWWKHEKFDISSLVANSNDVKIRWVLVDGNNTGSAGRNGWFIDSIFVNSSFSEMIPPSVTLLSPAADTTLMQNTPYEIKAHITDDSGIDTAYIAYTSNNGVIDTVPMSLTLQQDTFIGHIPFIGFGREIHYKIIAKDMSFANNEGIAPNNGTFVIRALYVPSLGNVLYSEGFESGIPSTWTQSTTDGMDWSINQGKTG